jgi:hypothetical protein
MQEGTKEPEAFARVMTFQVVRDGPADGSEPTGLEPMLHDDDRGSGARAL